MPTIELIPSETIGRFAKLLLPAAVAYVVLRSLGFQTLFTNDSEGIGVLLQIIGTLYSVLYAFATYVIWGQFTAVESEILKESGALKDLVIFSNGLQPAAREEVLQAIRVYGRGVSESEWIELANGEKTEKTDRQFSELVSAVVSIRPENEAERLVYERLLEITNQVSTHRDERLSLSIKRIPRTLIMLVTLTAAVLILLLFVYPFRSLVLGVVSLAITATLLGLAHFVITDLDNPFAGIWNVTPEPFEQLVKHAR
jgi:Protein of unknown function (DUF4239)